MNRLFIAVVSAMALIGLAACGEGGDNAAPAGDAGGNGGTQSTAPLEAPATQGDDTTTQGIVPEGGEGGTQMQQ
ncbi:hypothetical protein [Chelativorans intermedius]|uniref:Lipoprotein n=1 Tax=Chelativorans intermedius TaxID=515947 RepID=A0ABV6D870_9HYPH|nr:hypothetical protein [Chelativorans intermedius]MCT8996863.1 hypothetical protein [Chelativorans intermedius]